MVRKFELKSCSKLSIRYFGKYEFQITHTCVQKQQPKMLVGFLQPRVAKNISLRGNLDSLANISPEIA